MQLAKPDPFVFFLVSRIRKVTTSLLWACALLYCGLSFGMDGKLSIAREVVDSSGKRILQDKQGKQVLLQLQQHSPSAGFIETLQMYPTYWITVYADHTVVYYGASNVKIKGAASHTLTEEQYGDLVRILRNLDVEKIKSARQGILYYAQLNISVSGVVQEMYFDGNNWRQYVTLRKSLEEYLHTMDYRCPVDDPIRDDVNICRNVFELDNLHAGGAK